MKLNASSISSIYIHYPFCVQKCPYCDFNSYALSEALQRKSSVQEDYIDAVVKEIELRLSQFADSKLLISSLFFGGGTPSLMSVAQLERIFETLSRYTTFGPDAEISLEANPGTLSEELSQSKLEAFNSIGINRVSLGVQSFDEEKLKFLGRWHEPQDVFRAVENLTASGLNNYNIDLMFATQGETTEAWKRDLETAISLQPKHIALYSLTIEPGTEFFRRAKKGTALRTDDSTDGILYEAAVETLASNDLHRYEISNFSRPGFSCRHNQAYWQREYYYGFGAGAHGFLDASSQWGLRYKNAPAIHDYISRCSNGTLPHINEERLDTEQALLEHVLLGLRQARGIALPKITEHFGTEAAEHLRKAAAELHSLELTAVTDETITLTKKGFLVADSVIESLVDALPRLRLNSTSLSASDQ